MLYTPYDFFFTRNAFFNNFLRGCFFMSLPFYYQGLVFYWQIGFDDKVGRFLLGLLFNKVCFFDTFWTRFTSSTSCFLTLLIWLGLIGDNAWFFIFCFLSTFLRMYFLIRFAFWRFVSCRFFCGEVCFLEDLFMTRNAFWQLFFGKDCFNGLFFCLLFIDGLYFCTIVFQ